MQRSIVFICFMGIVLWLSVGVSCGGGGVNCGAGTVRQGNFCVAANNNNGGKDGGGAAEKASEEKTPEFTPEPAAPEPTKPEPSEPEASSGGRVGEACLSSTPKCPNDGICLKEGYCTKTCKTVADCPSGMECRQINHQLPDGKWKTFTGCVRKTTQRKPCRRDQDCASHESCMIDLAPGGDALLPKCTRSIPGGKPPGEACDPNKGIQCRTGLCISGAFCSNLCVDDKDCTGDYKCSEVEMGLPNGQSAKIKACAPKVIKCENDKVCPKGTVCQLFVKKDQSGLDFYCSPVNRAGAGAGLACDPRNAQYGCYNNLCVDTGFCLGLCKENADCKAGFQCVTVESQLKPGVVAKFKGCAPKGDHCKRNADCPKDMVCFLGINQTQDKLVPFCAVRPLHTQKPGSPCKAASQNPKDQCDSGMCLGDQYCSSICVTEKDCPKDYICRDLTVQLPNNKQDTVKGCTKKQ